MAQVSSQLWLSEQHWQHSHHAQPLKCSSTAVSARCRQAVARWASRGNIQDTPVTLLYRKSLCQPQVFQILDCRSIFICSPLWTFPVRTDVLGVTPGPYGISCGSVAYTCMCFASGASILGVLYPYMYIISSCNSQLLYELNYDIVDTCMWQIL